MAIAIVHNDQATFLNYGVRQVGTSEPVDQDTVFQLASVSKPITSTILAKLVGEQRFGWDDPIAKYDPDFRLSDPYVTSHVTFRDLLSHRSGLPGQAGDLLEDLGYDRQQILERLRFYDLQNRWRAKYAYTNFGVTEAAVAGALASGRNLAWDDLAAELLFRPLGMNSTSAKFADFKAAQNRAVGHVPADGKWFANGQWAPLYVREPDAQAPAGGVSSTTRDLVQWMRLTLNRGMLNGERFIDPDAIAAAELLAKQTGRKVFDILDEQGALGETHQPAMLSGYDAATGQSRTYGLCWNIGSGKTGLPVWSHSGEFGLGARTVVAFCPQENFGIVVLTNAAPQGVPEGLQLDFFDLVLLGKVSPPEGYRDWLDLTADRFRAMTEENQSADPIDYTKPAPKQQASQPLPSYAGAYANPFYGDLQIDLVDGALHMTLGPKHVEFPLTHYSGDTFYFTTQGEMQSGLSGAVFARDGAGDFSATLNAYNKEGLGRFVRKP